MARGDGGTQIALRIPSQALKRADALIPKLARNTTISALGHVTRSTVMKLALMRGLELLEQEYK